MKSNTTFRNGFSKNAIQSVINKIVKILKVPELAEEQIRAVINEAQRIDRRNMEQHGMTWVIDKMAVDLANLFRGYSRRMINYHEIQNEQIGVNSEGTNIYQGSHIGDDGDPIIREEEKKSKFPISRIINVDNLFGLNKAYNIRNMFNPQANLSTAYFNIDTRYRILDSITDNSINEFRFNTHHDHTFRQGSINIIGYIRDIVMMEIAPFKIPKTSNEEVENEIIQYKKVTLGFNEFDSQGVIAHENRFYHFEFVVKDEEDRFYDLVPLPNTAARFYFRKPITALSDITISFGTPYQVLLFDKDRIVFTITNPAAGILRFTTATGENHNLTVGDLVYMEKFNTDNQSSDISLIQSMNRSRGQKISNVFNTVFDIDIAALGISDPVGNIIPQSGIELYLGSKRILFTVRLSYISPLDENED